MHVLILPFLFISVWIDNAQFRSLVRKINFSYHIDSRTCKVSKFDEYSTLRHTNALEEITEGSLDEENTYSKLRGTFKRKEEGEMKEEFQLPLHATVKMENS